MNLGKIFDITYQRDRAINEYKAAQRTGDDTRGAQDEAAKYIETPFKRKSGVTTIRYGLFVSILFC
jgi:hypothetical protein